MVGREIFPGTAETTWKKYQDTPAERGLQKEISSIVTDRVHEDFLRGEEIQNDDAKRIRWTAISDVNAGLWLTTMPCQQLMRIADEHFRAAARIRLGLPPHDHVRCCKCGIRLDTDPHHMLSCRLLLGMNSVRHNILRDTLIRVASAFHTPTVREPIVDYTDASRGDAAFYFRAKPAIIDVSVVNPLAGSYAAIATKPLAVAEKMEKEKELKYGTRVRGIRSHFYPFVVEATGGFGPRTAEFIEKFIEDIRCGGTQTMIQGSIANYLRRVVAAALCRGNGLLYEEGIRKSRKNYDHY